MRPIIALAMGDPAGISPELTARLLALDDVTAKARLVVIGDRRALGSGARVGGMPLKIIARCHDDRYDRQPALSVVGQAAQDASQQGRRCG